MKIAASTILILAVTASAVAVYVARVGRAACESADGKWASTGLACPK